MVNPFIDAKYNPGDGVLKIQTPFFSKSSDNKKLDTKPFSKVLSDFVIDRSLGAASKGVSKGISKNVPNSVKNSALGSTFGEIGSKTGENVAKKVINDDKK